MSSGNTATATAPSTRSVARRNTADTTISSTVPVANGTGASTETAASVSTPTRATRSPSGRRSCHDSGWRTRRSTTPWPSVPATRHCVVPAHVRRITTPVARSRPMPMISPTPAATVPAATEPSSKRGTITWSVTHCTAMLEATVHRANIAAPATAMRNVRRCSDTMARSIRMLSRARSNRRVETSGTTERFYRLAPGHGTPGRVRRWRTPVGRVPACTRPISRCSPCGSCSACSSPSTATTRCGAVGSSPAPPGGSSRSGCAGRTSRPASLRRPSSAPGSCSPSAC